MLSNNPANPAKMTSLSPLDAAFALIKPNLVLYVRTGERYNSSMETHYLHTADFAEEPILEILSTLLDADFIYERASFGGHMQWRSTKHAQLEISFGASLGFASMYHLRINPQAKYMKTISADELLARMLDIRERVMGAFVASNLLVPDPNYDENGRRR